jgi:hypothetical protein
MTAAPRRLTDDMQRALPETGMSRHAVTVQPSRDKGPAMQHHTDPALTRLAPGALQVLVFDTEAAAA